MTDEKIVRALRAFAEGMATANRNTLHPAAHGMCLAFSYAFHMAADAIEDKSS